MTDGMTALRAGGDAPLRMTAQATSPTRNAGLDALKAALTVLVVFHHAAIAYGASGSWFYQEIAPNDSASSLVLTIFCTLNQAFFMGLFFLIAGSMTPGAIGRRGAGPFLRERFMRLGLPLVAFVLVLGPLAVALGKIPDGAPVLATLSRLAAEGAVIPGPMWFVEALLIFSVGYAALRAAAGPQRLETARPFPSNTLLAAGALGVGAVAFLARLRWPVGQAIFALQLGYFPGYVVLFLAGCLGAKGRWLERIPDGQMRAWLTGSLGAAIALVAVLTALRASGGDAAPASGGWNALAAFYAFWEPLFAWGVILALLVVFQRRFVVLGPVWSRLARRAYLIYIIHPPVLVAVSLLLGGLAAPALLKVLLAGSAASALCFVLAGALLLIPAIRRVV